MSSNDLNIISGIVDTCYWAFYSEEIFFNMDGGGVYFKSAISILVRYLTYQSIHLSKYFNSQESEMKMPQNYDRPVDCFSAEG